MGVSPESIVADAGPDYTDSCMIALYPPADLAATLALPDGLAPDDLHVTLIYLGPASEVGDLDDLSSIIEDIATFNPPLVGEIGGLGTFFGAEDPDENGQDPVVALIDVDGLSGLRAALLAALNDQGFDQASSHDFTPHMTLAYEEPGAPLPTSSLGAKLPVDVTFRELVLVVGDQKTPFSLGHVYQPVQTPDGGFAIDPNVSPDSDTLGVEGVDPEMQAEIEEALSSGLTDDQGAPVCIVCAMPEDFAPHEGVSVNDDNDPVATIGDPVPTGGDDDDTDDLADALEAIGPGLTAAAAIRGSVVDRFAIVAGGACAGPGPCDTNPLGLKMNWVNKAGGLPVYIRAIAHALQRSGQSESGAIQMAIGTVKRWAAGGGKVSAAVRARAAAALAQWEALRAHAHVASAALAEDYWSFELEFCDEFAWNEALHPRGQGGKFAPLGSGAGYNQSTAKGEKDNRRVKNVQKMLGALGISVGEAGVDGKLGPDTKAAIQQFQRNHGIKPTGIVNEQTIKSIRHASRNKIGAGRVTPGGGGASRGGASTATRSPRTAVHARLTQAQRDHQRAVRVHQRKVAAHQAAEIRRTDKQIEKSRGSLRKWENANPTLVPSAARAAARRSAPPPSPGWPRPVHAAATGPGIDVAGDPPPDSITHAGVAVKAGDTGRVLMLQRGLNEPDDPAAGKWEFPGGGVEPGDPNPWGTAMREWSEEVGQPFPEGTLAHQWTAPSGTWQGHTFITPTEDSVDLGGIRHVDNPDDPDGDGSEQVAWWDPDDAAENPALRPEVEDTPWEDLKQAKADAPATEQTVTVASLLRPTIAAPRQFTPVPLSTLIEEYA